MTVNFNRLFQSVPLDIERIIVGYCNDKTIIQMSKVCRTWRQNILIKEEKLSIENYIWGVKEGYPDELLQVFRKCGILIQRVPELKFEIVNQKVQQKIQENLKAGKKKRDNIWNVSLDPKGNIIFNIFSRFLYPNHLDAPIMYFRANDIFNKDEKILGVAFSVAKSSLDFSERGIFVIHQRSSRENDKNLWLTSVNSSFYPTFIKTNEGYIKFDSLIPFLSGRDELIKIVPPPKYTQPSSKPQRMSPKIYGRPRPKPHFLIIFFRCFFSLLCHIIKISTIICNFLIRREHVYHFFYFGNNGTRR